MAYETLLLEQQQAVLTITVNRPEVLNAQSRIMREEFDHALAMAAEDDTVRVLLVPSVPNYWPTLAPNSGGNWPSTQPYSLDDFHDA